MKPSKIIFHAALSAILCLSMLMYSSCDGDPGATQTRQEEVTAMLVGKTWKLQSVSVDNVDKSSLFTGMTISFSNSSFTVTNATPVWPASGTWSFTSDEATFVKRNDNVEVKVEPTATTLKLTLSWTKTTLGPGKVASIAGQHVFTFGL
jgi:hypothetical protein